MKKCFFIAALALQSSLLIAQNNASKEPFVVKSLASESIKDVQVTTAGGSISVSGVAATEAKVEVYVSPGDNKRNLTKEEIQAIITEKYDLNISVANNKLTATAKSKLKNNDWKNSLSFSFKVYVPTNVSTDLNTSGGSINLSNLTGNLNFSTSGGSLNIDNAGGTVRGRTSGGSISLKNSKDDIDLATSGGSVNAKNCDGKLKLTTSGGSLHLEDLKGEIKATTSGGSVEGENIQGELVTHTSGGSIRLSGLSCSLDASTSGGGIHVAVVNPGKYIKINNSAGNVDLQLPKSSGLDLNLYANKIKTNDLVNFNGKMNMEGSNDEIVGKLNGGGVPVTVNAGSGNIHLELK
jgi:hypothetical protein